MSTATVSLDQPNEITAEIGAATDVAAGSATTNNIGSMAESALLARTQDAGFALGAQFRKIETPDFDPQGDLALEPVAVSGGDPIAKLPATAEASTALVEHATALHIFYPDLTAQATDSKIISPPAQAGNDYNAFLMGAIFNPPQPILTADSAQLAQLPPTVAAQLIHHSAAAKAGPVELLLTPDDLGHLKFQIHHEGETVRVVLAAERPETLDLLRRHGDQLLQEFRHAGFSGATLSFGEWSQQDRAPAPKTPLPEAAEVAFEPLTALQTRPMLAALPDGRGLNLRL